MMTRSGSLSAVVDVSIALIEVIAGLSDFTSNGASFLLVSLSAEVRPATSVVVALTDVLSATLSSGIVTLTLPFSVVGVSLSESFSS
ncbi:hypothetical protein HS327_02231 [Glaesserella parasuis]|nr:hypothetical protein HS327_02231 [Glaesserella parasuis]